METSVPLVVVEEGTTTATGRTSLGHRLWMESNKNKLTANILQVIVEVLMRTRTSISCELRMEWLL